MEIDGPGTQGGGHFGVGFGEAIGLAPLEIVGQEAIFGRVVAHGEEHGVRHVGLEADGLGAVHHFEQLHVIAPAMHAGPADLAFGGEAFAEALGDGGGFAEGLGDAFGVGVGIFGPIGGAGGGIDAHDAVLRGS